MRRTRLAPSPTGALHLGNARTFLLTWLWARVTQAEVVLRVEDLDGPRTKAGAVEQALDDDVDTTRQALRRARSHLADELERRGN